MANSPAGRIPLPASATSIPIVGFGTWKLTGQECYDAVTTALRLGCRHLDTATLYRNEAEIGRALRDSGVPREDVFLTTKLRPEDAGRAPDVLTASLDALGTDRVDLWLIHWPPLRGADPDTWTRLLTERDAGRATAVGVSNYSPAQIDELVAATGEAPAVNQIRWSPALYDPAVLAHHRAAGVVVEGYSPFRSGRLTGRVLTGIAAAHEVSPAQVVLRWHLQHEIVVIPKSARPDRIAANLDLFGFALDPDEMERLDGLSRAG